MTPEFQIFSVISWLIVLKIIQTGLWPVFKGTFKEYAYPVSYPLSLMLFALFSWYAGIAGIPVQAAVIPFVAAIVYFAFKGEYSRDAFEGVLKWDLVFLILFLFMLEVRYLNPSVSYAEKFMDHAFLASVMRNPVVVPLDPWYAGGSLNVYYYLGHWMMGALGLTAFTKSAIVFNLILPTVLANAGLSLYAFGRLMLKKYCWLPLAALFLVNPSFIHLALTGSDINGIMWGSTRTIEGAITEFPIFSMLWGDPHAHVISIMNQCLFIFIMAFILKRWSRMEWMEKVFCGLAAALSLGTMPPVNSWDVLFYAPLFLLFAGYILYRDYSSGVNIRNALYFLVTVPVVSVLIYAPFYLMMDSAGIEGVGIVNTPTDIVPFMLVWGIFIVILYAETARDIWKETRILILAIPFLLLGYLSAAVAVIPAFALIKRKNKSPADLFAIAGLLLITLVEIIYLKDNMGDTYYRMNTVFKFSIVAWLMLAVSSLYYIGAGLIRLYERRNGGPDAGFSEEGDLLLCGRDELSPSGVPEVPGFGSVSDSVCSSGRRTALLVIVLAVIFAVPVILPDMNYGYGGKTLDGTAWMKVQQPYDYDAVSFLNGLEGNLTIVEAEGGDYTYYSRISSMTGIPSVIGMPFHEQMWRGDEGNVGARMGDVRKIYENPADTVALMQKYGAGLLYVGEAEREAYDVNIPEDSLRVIFENEEVTVYSLL
ncbi:DUF2298 domain-containing protein [Methanoplanus endosymbiosus]|uniref:DUF2298 domain-containing protein n=1 Tax=Methanoplanus endosymbiosus TaxID=33865 RepID=A0A9E7TL26_9EURY|nr:DUF2298 domain-containing protein [Methanoplanus endosymbiosus]UUX91861.1 DUF2298 domain-containing protein [Methanoplanus endosymbiosus]